MQKHHSPQLLSNRDVVGTATGVDRNGQFTIKVYAKKARVPNLPKELDGMAVIVEATGEFYALQGPRHRGPNRYTRRPPSRHRGWDRDRNGGGHDGEVQDSAPTVMIVAPADGEIVADEVLVSAIAEDDGGVASVEFSVEGVLLHTDVDGTDGWTYVWDSTVVDDSQYTLSVRATDTIGQASEDNVEVVVDNEEGPFSQDGRPTPIGVSTGNGNECSSGTITCRVRDAQGNVYALSNNHVYARLNDAVLGELFLQPGLFDTDCRMVYSDQVIGVLSNFVPLDFSQSGDNQIDAAIALTTEADTDIATPSDGYGKHRTKPAFSAHNSWYETG